jgi:DNA-binding GntR family transcriptional regulator
MEPRSLIESAYLRIRNDIIGGRHRQGERLRVEHLKGEYHVGAGTLREALALLVSDSLVVSRFQRGFWVAPMSMADLEDLTRTRTLLECAAIRDSVCLGDSDWQDRVRVTYDALSRAEERLALDPSGGVDDWERCNRDFHDALTSACPSGWILRFRALLYQQAERYRRLSAHTQIAITSVHDEHQRIYEAAIERNVELAEHQLALHIQLALTVIRRSGVLR